VQRLREFNIMVLYVYFAYLVFFKRLFYCSEMYKYLHEFYIKLFQIPVYMRLLI